MKILITGANGQLGKDLYNILTTNKDFEVVGFGREEMDITDMHCVRTVIKHNWPDIVIHSAAYTQVDKAETDVDQAYLVNGFGTRNIALAANEVGAKVCYISTDYVFNGQNASPYHEYDIANPQSVYGKSKYAGEDFIKTMSSKYFIVRTSWVYGLHGQNFVKTMLKLAKERDQVAVVDDQTGSPTYTADLAGFLGNLIRTEKYGIYHASNSGACTWFEFARAIFEEAGVEVKLNPITTAEFPTLAQRPKYSVLDHIAIRANGFDELRQWREALRDFIQEYKVAVIPK